MAKSKFRVFGQMWQFLKVNKKFWLLPMMVVLILFGILLAVAQGSAFAPFIYAIF